jgi:hypothetical protein
MVLCCVLSHCGLFFVTIMYTNKVYIILKEKRSQVRLFATARSRPGILGKLKAGTFAAFDQKESALVTV